MCELKALSVSWPDLNFTFCGSFCVCVFHFTRRAHYGSAFLCSVHVGFVCSVIGCGIVLIFKFMMKMMAIQFLCVKAGISFKCIKHYYPFILQCFYTWMWSSIWMIKCGSLASIYINNYSCNSGNRGYAFNCLDRYFCSFLYKFYKSKNKFGLVQCLTRPRIRLLHDLIIDTNKS